MTAPPHGRDRRARLLPAAPGAPAPAGTPPHVVVAGGGIAGLAATTALAERGVRVTLLEGRAMLGGRLAGWPIDLQDGTRATMSRGFHAFFRQYYNLRGLLRRTDPELRRLTALPDYPLRHSAGHQDGFARVPRTPPWNVLGFVARSPTFGMADLFAMDARAAMALLDVRVPEVYERLDDTGAADFLATIRFPPAASHLAFEVFSRSFFVDPARLSAAELAVMFHIYFLGSAEGLLFDVPNRPFPVALWDPLARYLFDLGVDVRTDTAVEAIEPIAADRHRVITAEGELTCDATVLALDTRGLRDVVAASVRLGDLDWRNRVAALRNAPPFLVSRLWLDRCVRSDRPGFLGTSGFGPLDNVSVLERWEDEAAGWARRTGGSVVELHAYAVQGEADRMVVQRNVLAELRRVYPEIAQARVVDARHEWRADCPLFAVGGHRDRPTVTTPHPTLMLAGDLVRTDLPVALMERAATTGFLAANALLHRWGVRGHALWTVPQAGRSRMLRALARRL